MSYKWEYLCTQAKKDWKLFRLNFDWILIQFWLNFDSILTEFWLHFDWILTEFQLHFDWILTAFWQATFWLNFDCILTTFWLHFDCILTVFWLHFDWILTEFWMFCLNFDNILREGPGDIGKFCKVSRDQISWKWVSKMSLWMVLRNE